MKGEKWNECDNVGEIVIYNAERSKMNGVYDVAFNFIDPTKNQVVEKGAVYNASTDQLVFSQKVDFGTEFAYLDFI